MKIDVVNVMIGVGAGLGDEVFEWMDREAIKGAADKGEISTRNHPLKGVRDWGRIGMVGLGFLGQAMDFYPKQASALAQSSMPLLVKTASAAMRNVKTTEEEIKDAAAPIEAGRTRAYSQPGVASATSSRSRVTWRPKAVEP